MYLEYLKKRTKNRQLGFLGLLLEASLAVQMGKNLHAMQQTHVRSLGWKDPVERRMENTHSSILA